MRIQRCTSFGGRGSKTAEKAGERLALSATKKLKRKKENKNRTSITMKFSIEAIEGKRVTAKAQSPITSSQQGIPALMMHAHAREASYERREREELHKRAARVLVCY